MTVERTLPPDLHPDTLAVRVAIDRSQYGENSEALYLTTGFVQPNSATSAERFQSGEGYTYARTSNPTVTAFERRLAALEGTEAAIGAASGMGAILMMIMGLLKSGDHVVLSRSMFGSTLNLFAKEFGKFGVETTFVSQTDVAEWRAAVKPHTKLLFAETPTNPLTEVCDIAALASIAHDAGALLAVDNAFATPVLQKPAALGADIVMHSGTKYLDGQGRVMAGALCGSQALITELQPADQVSLVTFNEVVALPCPLSTNRTCVGEALNTATPEGETALIDGVLAGMVVGESEVGRSLLMVFSDGLDTASFLGASRVLELGRRSDVVVYPVTSKGARPDFVEELASLTGGRLFEIDQRSDLSATFRAILDEFRYRYLVTYTPRGVERDGWHTLDVQVKRPGARVKARPGYQGR